MKDPAPKIYIESCQFIDLAKHRANLHLSGETSQNAIRETNVWYTKQLIRAALKGEIRIFTSMLTVAECTHLKDGRPTPDDATKQFLNGLLTSGKGGVTLVSVSHSIIEEARDLRWKHSICLGAIDSIHVASAIRMQCQELVTTDGKITSSDLTRFKLKVIQAKDTSILPSDSLQGLMKLGK